MEIYECIPERVLIDIKHMVEIQCRPGTYDYDPYMHGMANGMIFILSILEGKEPKYLDAPKQWLKDKAKED